MESSWDNLPSEIRMGCIKQLIRYIGGSAMSNKTILRGKVIGGIPVTVIGKGWNLFPVKLFLK